MSGRPEPPVPSTFESDTARGEEIATETAVDPILEGWDRPQTILVVGAGGFLGRHLSGRLRSRGHRVRGLGRTGRPGDGVPGAGLDWVAADIADRGQVAGVAEGCDTVVHLAGIRRESGRQTFRRVHVEGTRHLLRESVAAEVRRFIYVSVLGAADGAAELFHSKHQAEQIVRGGEIEHVIFRPSIVFGPDDHFITVLRRWLRRLPIFPVPGERTLLLQPAAIEDVTDALCQAVERSDVREVTYELIGPSRLALAKIVRIVARFLELRSVVVPVPRAFSGGLSALSDRFGLPVTLAREQGKLLLRRGVARRDQNAMRSVFHLEPMPFRQALADYL